MNKLLLEIQEEVERNERRALKWAELQENYKKRRQAKKPVKGSVSYLDSLEKVRELVSRHNHTTFAPQQEKFATVNAKTLGWEANDYVRWIIAGKPISNNRRMVKVGEKWHLRKKDLSTKSLGTTSFFEAVKKRDELIAAGE
jgi:hypothetical protein